MCPEKLAFCQPGEREVAVVPRKLVPKDRHNAALRSRKSIKIQIFDLILIFLWKEKRD